MSPGLGLLLGLAIGAGILLVISGFTPAPPPPPRNQTPFESVTTRLKLTPREGAILAGAAAASLLVAAVTGWFVLVPVVPAVTVGLLHARRPSADQQSLERLDALDDWVRSLRGTVTSNMQLPQALAATLGSTPPAIQPQVEVLVARLHARRPAAEALRAFADDLNDPLGDLVASSLVLAADDNTGLVKILDSLATMLSRKVRARQAIERSRSGTRAQAKALTVFIPLFVTAFVFGTSFGATYRTPVGQLVLAVLSLAFIGCLVWLNKAATTKPAPRFLVRDKKVAR